MSNVAEKAAAGVLRRLGAMFYDALLVIALMIIATAAFLPLTGGEAITAASVGVLAYVYRCVLLAITVLFFGLFWTRSGQTLGMTAWRLRLERTDLAPVTWRDALVRLAGACVSWAAVGLGYFWIWIDRDRLAWHDRWSGTRVIVLPKRS
ncbi:MAG: RDD family protein [Steroidobacter sp.]